MDQCKIIIAIDLEDRLATVEYFVNPPNSWPLVDQERVRQYFIKLNLGIRFSKEANNQLQTLNSTTNKIKTNYATSYVD